MPTFVLIGHCGPDAHLLKNAVARAVPGAAIVFANDAAALRPHLNGDGVLLVNRVLEDGFDTESGIELIRELAQDGGGDKPAMLLVSNFAEAQQEALAAGARPGFGKRDVFSERTLQLLREAAGVRA